MCGSAASPHRRGMTETAATPPLDPPTDSPLFIRPREGRMIAGVCKGIAERWNLDLTLVRIVTVVLTLFTGVALAAYIDRKSTRLNSSHMSISYAVFCLKKKNNT